MFIHDSHNAILKAQHLGLEKGREEGREERMEQGMQQKVIEIARELLDVLDIQTISQKTGLSVAEIQKLV